MNVTEKIKNTRATQCKDCSFIFSYNKKGDTIPKGILYCHLHAADPELLEAAQYAMEIIGAEHEPYFQRVYNQLKSAIGKAEGK